MNIAFLSSLDPINILNWSGTLYYMYHSLEKKHNITWIGGKLFTEIVDFHHKNITPNEQTAFVPEKYASLFGKKLSDWFKHEYYDLIVCRDYFFLAYLLTDIPIIYVADTTFKLLNNYLNYTDFEFIALAEELERKAIHKATHIVYASEWAKNSAISDYQANPSRISVFEFGANIEEVPAFRISTSDNSTCNLLFIGRNWEWKGGDKVIEIYRTLKQRGISCTLTLIGSIPPEPLKDTDIHLYPYINKSTEEGRNKFTELLQQSHFLIAPTRFDCFGIVYAEVAAYGIPVLTSNVGGVSQAVHDGENGFLFPIDCSADYYVNRIIELYSDTVRYSLLRQTARKHYEKRLNWNVWLERMDKLFTDISNNEEGVYIPIYAINMKSREKRRQHIVSQFEGRKEFDFHLVEACEHSKGTIGLWNSIVKIIRMAKEQKEKVIIICEDDHFFTENYSWRLLLKQIQEAYNQRAEILSGGIGGFGQAIPTGNHRYWVDWFWCTQFIVIYASLFDTILSYEFKENDTADGVLSALAYNKMVIYPFISEQIDFGYSDVTQSNMDNKGRIREHFESANRRFKALDKIFNLYKETL